MIWLNKDILYKGKMLFYMNWINSDILFVGDLMDDKGFLPIDKISAKIVIKDGRWYSQYARIRQAIQLCGNMSFFSNTNLIQKKYSEFRSNVIVYNDIRLVYSVVSLSKLTVRKIYHELIQTKIEDSRAEEFWCNTLVFDCLPVWTDVWLFKLKYVKDNVLINFNFKFMYNILATPANLFKWKLKQNDQCFYCDQKGDCRHMFFSCDIVIMFWKKVEESVQKYILQNFHFQPCLIVSGISFSSKEKSDVDIILNYALYTIYKCFAGKESKRKITIQRLINILFYLLRYRLQIEENVKSRKPCISHQKWRQMLTL